jgi:hypothetical protein
MHRSKRRARVLATAWIALLAVVYAALSPALAAAVLADRPAALARMLGLPHQAAIADAHEEHEGHGAHQLPTPSEDDAAHYAHGIYCSFCLNAGSTAALLAPPVAHAVAAVVSIAAVSPRPQAAAAAVHPSVRSRAPPHVLPALS